MLNTMPSTRNRAIARAVALLLMTAGVCRAQSKPAETGKQIAAVESGPTTVLSASNSGFFVPKGAQAWTPTAADLAHLEADIRKLAKDTPVPYSASNPNGPKSILVYYRQYIGYTQGGKRYIYVNAFCPSVASEFTKWRQQPALVSDGGACFYHVVYEVKKHRFDGLRFNGYA